MRPASNETLPAVILTMIIRRHVAAVETLLRTTAQRRQTCSFGNLFALFGDHAEPKDVYETLECASKQLAPWADAIFSAVLAKRDGQPGDGFLDVFRNHRQAEYAAIAGAQTPIPKLTSAQRLQMADRERLRVYAIAEAHRR